MKPTWSAPHIALTPCGLPTEPATRAMIDTPGLYWCYYSDSWKQWEPGDESLFGQFDLAESHVVEISGGDEPPGLDELSYAG